MKIATRTMRMMANQCRTEMRWARRSPGWRHCALRKFGWFCESCSGLVDLVVGVGHHRGSRHRLTSPGERFVGLVAEDIAQIGDGGGELGVRCRGEGAEGEASDGGRRFIASEPVEKGSEDSQLETDHCRFARVVEIPDSKCD